MPDVQISRYQVSRWTHSVWSTETNWWLERARGNRPWEKAEKRDAQAWKSFQKGQEAVPQADQQADREEDSWGQQRTGLRRMGPPSLLTVGQKDLGDSTTAGAVEKDQVHPPEWRRGLQWALEEEVLVDPEGRLKQWAGWGVFWGILSQYQWPVRQQWGAGRLTVSKTGAVEIRIQAAYSWRTQKIQIAHIYPNDIWRPKRSISLKWRKPLGEKIKWWRRQMKAQDR